MPRNLSGSLLGYRRDHAEMLVLMAAEGEERIGRSERQEETLYTTLEPCALCMAAAMTFLLGTIVYAASAPLDGGVNLPDLWQPPNGHPVTGMPYSIPKVIGGIESDASVELIAEWINRAPDRTWASSYVSATPLA